MMTRNAAIQHFSARKYAGVSIAQALAAAPAAVSCGLAVRDHEWISKHSTESAHASVARLYARSISNRDGVVRA